MDFVRFVTQHNGFTQGFVFTFERIDRVAAPKKRECVTVYFHLSCCAGFFLRGLLFLSRRKVTGEKESFMYGRA